MYSKSFLILFLLFPIFGYSETMIINIETKYDDGYAMLGIYDKKNNFGHILTWIPDLGAVRPPPGRIFHVESQLAVKNARCQRPEA